MRIYFDVSCLNRPFDRQSQERVRLEAEAVDVILRDCERGRWEHVSSAMARLEIDAIPDRERRARVRLLLPDESRILELTTTAAYRVWDLEALGFRVADAFHVAAAEEWEAAALLSCDDRLCRRARRYQHQLAIRVTNPLDWLKETRDGAHQ